MSSFRITTTLITLLVGATYTPYSSGVLGFSFTIPLLAVTSSQSPKKRKITNQEKAAGGFGKPTDTVPIIHVPDLSDSTIDLMEFLNQWESTGFGLDPDAGTEIGISEKTQRRGVYATKAFKKNEILCKIPSDCALALVDPNDVDATEESTSVTAAAKNVLEWYVQKEDAAETWSWYLNTLPIKDEKFDPTPDFFSDDEVEALEYPLAVKLAKERKEGIMALSADSGIPFEELQFAAWLVSSRGFEISVSVDDKDLVKKTKGGYQAKKKTLRLLLPYIDMINHSSDNANAELHLIDPEKDDAWFAIRATRPIKSGKEITMSYGGSGVESSVGLLMNYGFVPDENRIDGLMLKKGGEDSIESVDGWKTSLEEDEQALEAGGLDGNMETVLRFRTKLKRSYP